MDGVEIGKEEIRKNIGTALVKYRDATNHSNPLLRVPIEKAFEYGISSRYVNDALFYRVCDANDITFKSCVSSEDFSWRFVSTSANKEAADKLLRYAPNPMADRVVQIQVNGPVLDMIYDDDTEDAKRKSAEQEVLVPVRYIVKCVQL